MKIKVMVEHNSSGLWDIEQGGELGLERVVISDELRSLMRDWVSAYAHTVNWKNPKIAPLLTDEFKTQFNTLEDKVFDLLKKELGNNHELIFVTKKLPIK